MANECFVPGCNRQVPEGYIACTDHMHREYLLRYAKELEETKERNIEVIKHTEQQLAQAREHAEQAQENVAFYQRQLAIAEETNGRLQKAYDTSIFQLQERTAENAQARALLAKTYASLLAEESHFFLTEELRAFLAQGGDDGNK